MHPQTIEVAQQKEEEDMVNLLMRMNKRLLQTEKSLETALQQKQGELAPQPPETAPVSTTAPPVAMASIPPIDPASTASTSTLATTIIATTTGLDNDLSTET